MRTLLAERYAAAERVALKRWLRSRDIIPVSTTSIRTLIGQVTVAGGDATKLMDIGRDLSDRAVETGEPTDWSVITEGSTT